MGIKLFMHSVTLVLGDWRNALRLSGLLYLIYAVPSLLLTFLFPVASQSRDATAAGTFAYLPVIIIIGLLAFVVFVWIAVAWHRYILLNEVPAGQLPAFNQSRMLSYVGYSLLIGLIMFAAAMAVVLVTIPIVMTGVPALAIIVPVLSIFVLLVVGYRFGPVLPAAAIGKPLTLSQAWQATKGASGAILVLAIVSVLASVTLDIPMYLLAYSGQPGNPLGLVWTMLTGWVKILVGVSILTTLYGYYVEGRPLPAGG